MTSLILHIECVGDAGGWVLVPAMSGMLVSLARELSGQQQSDMALNYRL